jgi:hypothetical protein
MGSQKKRSSCSYDLQNYVVLFIDVLGQKEKILKFQLVPDDVPTAKQVVLDTAGHVDALRDRIHTLLKNQAGESEFSRSLPRKQRRMLKKLAKSEVFSQGLSDALVLAVPIGDFDEHSTPTNGIRWALTACCWTQLNSLAEGHPIRGGLEIGWGVRLGQSEVYGAALARAYQLESTVAMYPRVICGEELLRYLSHVEGTSPSSDFGRNAIQTAKHCKDYLFQDDDGLFAVDFLGAAFHEGASKVPGIETVIDAARDFVEEERARFTTDGNERLAARYTRLASYVRGRLDIWHQG